MPNGTFNRTTLCIAIAACMTAGCPTTTPTPTIEPLNLPDDPGATGAPVGTMSMDADGQAVQVWYPTSDNVDDSRATLWTTEYLVPDTVRELLDADFSLPAIGPGAIADAPVRELEAPMPVVVFSHGFGGFKAQSPDFAQHLASRGYLVISAEHPGRMLRDVLPCLFSPPLDGCDLSGMAGDDPALEDVTAVLDWLEHASGEGPFAGRIDLELVGMSGHSAGGGTTVGMGEDERIDALLTMGANALPSTPQPALSLTGGCDTFAPGSEAREAAAGVESLTAVEIEGAGHLAFSDLCQLEFGSLAEEFLLGRDDLNDFFINTLIDLATSGCPGWEPSDGEGLPGCAAGYMPLEESAHIIRSLSTTFFDDVLRGRGIGVDGTQMPGTVAD